MEQLDRLCKDKKDLIVPKGKHVFECAGIKFIVDDNYEFRQLFRYEKNGAVCEAKDKKTGEKVAIKKISKEVFDDLAEAKRILQEIRLLKFFNHENIHKIIKVMKSETTTGFEDIYIVTNIMDIDLRCIIQSKQILTNEHIQYFTYLILRGLLYMHSANVIHTELKPSNILINSNCDLQITNLTCAKGYGNKAERTVYVENSWYKAPEFLFDSSNYTKAVDIWSVGCIIAELLGKTALFPGNDCSDQYKRIIGILGTPNPEDLASIGNERIMKFLGSLPKQTKLEWKNLYPEANPLALDLLEKMLQFDPYKRYTAEECLSHPYFVDLHDPDDEPVCEEPFDWSSFYFKSSKELFQDMIVEEACKFYLG